MIPSTSAVLVGLAILAGATQGFLLPTTVSPTDNDIIESISFENAAQLNEQSLNLNCAGCPVATIDDSGNTVWLQGIDSELHLAFSIASDNVGDGVDLLILNGVQLFPPRAPSFKPLIAPQITAEGQHDLTLGYELTIRPEDHDQIEVISLEFQVVEVANKLVSGLDNVELKLLRLPAGKLLIGTLEVQPTKNPIINPSDSGEACTTLICKWRAIVSDKLSQLKSTTGCGSKTHSKHAGHRTHRHHGHHRHHHKHLRITRFFLALKTVAIHVLVPVFIGVAVGMTASLVGMLVGNLVIFLWRSLYRRGQRGSYSRLQQSENDGSSATHHEGKSQVGSQAPPPLYEVVMDEKSEL